jgi:hypothetical protein
MKIERLYLFIGAGLVVVFSIFWLLRKGELEVVVSADSPIKENIVGSVSINKSLKTLSVPSTIKLTPGTYTLFAVGENTEVFSQEIKVSYNKKSTVEVSLKENPSNALTGENVSEEELAQIPYFSLFPEITGDYTITASLNDERTAINKITIAVFHHFASKSEPDFYAQERNTLANAAKEWLRDQGVPESIPVEVTDQE